MGLDVRYRLMGKIFTITPGIRQIASDAIDDLINQLGKPCRLVYPPIYTACPNCVFDPIGNKSSNRYKHGGPVPFQFGNCPMCNGAGREATFPTEVVTLLCAWTPKQWFILPENLRMPDGDLQTKGYISDLPKIKRAVEMDMEISQEAYGHWRFKLASDPIDAGNIIQGRYCVCLWKRIS